MKVQHVSSEKPAQRHLCIFILLPVLIGLLAACQPTPSSSAIVNKGGDTLESAIRATASPTQKSSSAHTGTSDASVTAAPDVPEHIKTEFAGADSKVAIRVDADILIPSKPVPVTKVAPVSIPMELIRRIVDGLFQGNTPYEPKVGMTKSELQTEILKCQEFIGDWKKLVAYYGGDEAAAKDTKAVYTKRIQGYQAMLATAPQTIESKPTDWTFHPKAYYTDMVLFGEDGTSDDPQAKLTRDYYDKSQVIVVETKIGANSARVTASNLSLDSVESHNLTYSLGSTAPGKDDPAWDEAQTRPMTMTLEQTAAMVQRTLESIGLEGYELDHALSLRKPEEAGASTDGTAPGNGSGNASAQDSYGYKLIYVPTFGGVRAVDASMYYIAKQDAAAYGPRYGYEGIRVEVRNDQIVYLSWDSPTQVVETENTNVALLPTEQIMDRFQTYMKQKITAEWLTHQDKDTEGHKKLVESIESGEVNISQIKLVLWRMNIKDQPGKYRYVPIYRFVGTESLHIKGVPPSGDVPPAKAVYAWINALDGSIFDPYQGY